MTIARYDPSAQLPDGVHLNLPDFDYFAQDALGSTDLMRLHFRREGWWWSSRHNPDRVQRESTAQNYGSALHAILLEGTGAYEERFAVIPQKPADCIETVDEMKQALADEGFDLRGTGGWKKTDWALSMRTSLSHVPCWPNILEDFDIDRGTKRLVSGVEDRMLRFMLDVAMSPDRRDNAEIRHLFETSADRPPLAEVSILKTFPNGVRRRWRIDRMFPAFDMDLKSLGNWSGRPLEWETGDLIARNGYDIQRADYLEGRAVAYEFIRDGFQVYGGTLDQRKWLMTFPDEFQAWDWVWLFYQKPSPSGHAPVIFPVMDLTAREDTDGKLLPSEILTHGLSKKRSALALYERCVAEFGLGKPWARVDALHYTDETYEPRIFIPHFIAHDVPTEAEAYPKDDPKDA